MPCTARPGDGLPGQGGRAPCARIRASPGKRLLSVALGGKASPPRAPAAPRAEAFTANDLRARPVHLPVLRNQFQGPDHRSRSASAARGTYGLGKPGLLLPAV